MSEKIKVIHRDCDPSLSLDRGLPYTSYLVEYLQGETSHWDIVMCNKKVDIFDYYWDKYRHDLIKFNQTEGRLNPRLWSPPDKKK